MWPLDCGWISKILKNPTLSYYNEDFSLEKRIFIILYFISSLKIVFISWNFCSWWDHKPWQEPLDICFQFPGIPYTHHCWKAAISYRKTQTNTITCRIIGWCNHQKSYSRYSKDVNGFRADSLDSEFGIVEYYKLCFYFTKQTGNSPSRAVISCHHLQILPPFFYSWSFLPLWWQKEARGYKNCMLCKGSLFWRQSQLLGSRKGVRLTPLCSCGNASIIPYASEKFFLIFSLHFSFS